MSFNFKKSLSVLTALCLTFALAGCEDSEKNNNGNTENTQQTNGEPISSENANLQTDDMFSDRDLSGEYDEAKAVSVKLKGDSVETSANGVSFSDGVLTVKNEGIYLLSGDLNGQIVIDNSDDKKIQLVLDGVNITTDKACGIYVKNADKVFVTAKKDTQNTITTSGESYADGDTNVDGGIFSDCDLTLNGQGSLTIKSTACHGIVTKDDLKICGAVLDVTATGHGLKANDSIRVSSGEITVNSGKDGLHAENSDDSAKGFVYIENGKLNLNTKGDGIDSSMTVQIENGDFDITTTATDDASTKGIKANANLVINDGNFDLNTADDGLHCANECYINNGTFNISTGDDGIHSDENVIINDGTITISKSYEGIEGKTVTITGGKIDLVASDDGINASDGTSQGGFGFGRRNAQQGETSQTSDIYIKISGGDITVNAGGDGIDSNGSVYVSGGKTVIYGPTTGADGALDYETSAEITGGIFVALGSVGMAENFTDGTQGSIMVTVNNGSDNMILSDENGEILNIEGKKNYSSVVVSCPEIVLNGKYTISANGSETEVEMTSLIYGNGNGFGGGGFGNFPNRGDKPNQGGQMQKPDNMELPDDMEIPDDFDPGEMTPPDGMEIPDDFDPSEMTPPDGMEIPDDFDPSEMTPPDGMEKPDGIPQKPQQNQTDDSSAKA